MGYWATTLSFRFYTRKYLVLKRKKERFGIKIGFLFHRLGYKQTDRHIDS